MLTLGSHCVPLEITPRPVTLRNSDAMLVFVMTEKLAVDEVRRKLWQTVKGLQLRFPREVLRIQ